MNIRKLLALCLCAALALSLTACGGGGGSSDDAGKSDTSKTETVSTTPADILKAIQDALGDGWLCDAELEKDVVIAYYELDETQVEAVAAAESSNSSLMVDRVVVLQVKDGYAEDAVKALNTGFDQTLSYARMYGFDLPKTLGTRLYQSGNYIALITAGASGGELSDEEAAKLSDTEYAKIDEAWKSIFGSVPENQVVISEESTEDGFGYDDYAEGGEGAGGGIVLGG